MTTPRGKVHRFDFTAGDRSEDLHAGVVDGGVRARVLDRAARSRASALPSGAAQVMGYDAAGRLTSENHVQTKRSFDYDGERDQLRQGHARRWPTASDEQTMSRTPTTGCCRSRWSSAAWPPGRYEYTLGDRVLPTSEKLTVGATSITRALGVRQGPAGDQDRPVHDRAQGPGRRGLEDHRRQARRWRTPTTRNGRPAGRTLTVGGTERFFQKLTFNNVGRAGAREERVDGGALDTLDLRLRRHRASC